MPNWLDDRRIARERERRINRALGMISQLTLLRAAHRPQLAAIFAARRPLHESPDWIRYRSLIRREMAVQRWLRAQLNPNVTREVIHHG